MKLYSRKFIITLLAGLTLANTLNLQTAYSASAPRYIANNNLPILNFESSEPFAEVFELLPPSIQALKDSYQVIADGTDDYGYRHLAMVPVIESVQLVEYIILIHLDDTGKITSISGELDRPKLEIKNELTLPIAIARQNALKELGLPVENSEFHSEPTYAEESSALYIDLDTQQFVYHFNLTKTEDESSYEIRVNAQDGTIVSNKKVSLDPVSKQRRRTFKSTGTGINGDEYSLSTTQNDNTVYMTGEVAGTTLSTFIMNNKTLGYQLVKDDDGTFTDKEQAVAVQAHHNMSTVLNFFADNFNWHSFDGNFGDVNVIIDYTDDGTDLDNAFFDGDKFLFGAGDKELSYHNALALDIMGHEFTHGVNANTNSLAYENQSGALDESLADTFGVFVDPEDYLIGEDLLREGADEALVLRSIEDPTLYDQPAHFDDYVPADNTEEGDYGNVHLNAGIPSHAAYLIMEALGMENAQQLYFYTIQNYLFPYAEFSDMRVALKLAAQVLFENDQEVLQVIDDAWDNVGVNE